MMSVASSASPRVLKRLKTLFILFGLLFILGLFVSPNERQLLLQKSDYEMVGITEERVAPDPLMMREGVPTQSSRIQSSAPESPNTIGLDVASDSKKQVSGTTNVTIESAKRTKPETVTTPPVSSNKIDQKQTLDSLAPTTTPTPNPMTPSSAAKRKGTIGLYQQQDLVDQSCRDLTASSKAFSQDVFLDAETTSLTTWTSNDEQWQIPALSHDLLRQAFAGRKTYILGDSTTANLRIWINNLLWGTTPEFLSSLPNQTLEDGTEAVTSWQKEHGRYDKYWVKYPEYDNATLVWSGFRGTTKDRNCQFEDRMWPVIRKQKPDILVAHWGFHMLYREDILLCNLYQWIHYEDNWLESVFQLALEVGVKLLLFKVSNRVCAESFRYPPPGRDVCQQVVQNLKVTKQDPPRMLNVSQQDKDRYCNEALVREESSQRLNERLFHFVAKAQKKAAAHPSGMTVGIYNDHDMESCSYSDGIHYLPLGMPRVRLLAHTINCLYPENDALQSTSQQ